MVSDLTEIFRTSPELIKLALSAQLLATDKGFLRYFNPVISSFLNVATNDDSFPEGKDILTQVVEEISGLQAFARKVSKTETTQTPPNTSATRTSIKSALKKFHLNLNDFEDSTKPLSCSSTVHRGELPSFPISLPASATKNSLKRKPIKIYADGVFDLMHSGHFNAIRQAAQLGDELYVGVISDEEVLKAKGVYPIYSCSERSEIVRACKWVTGVISEAPYDVCYDFLKETGCDYAAHGDDVAINGDGQDCYAEIRERGLLKIFKRTEGVSTTTLVSRLLSVVDSVPVTQFKIEEPKRVSSFASELKILAGNSSSPSNSPQSTTPLSPPDTSVDESRSSSSTTGSTQAHSSNRFFDEEGGSGVIKEQKNDAVKKSLICSRRLVQFMGVPRQPAPGDRVVYVDGSFDVFHNGHVRVLQKSRELGDFLLVGIYDDVTVRRIKGPGYPVQSMLERALNVMAMRAVDEVIIGAPHIISEFLIKSYSINMVVKGFRADSLYCDDLCRQIPRSMGILKVIDSGLPTTTSSIVNRIIGNRDKIKNSVIRRAAREESFFDESIKKKDRIAEI